MLDVNAPSRDEWSEWLLNERSGGDADQARLAAVVVRGYVDRVLDGARLEPGMRLLDVGAGEGVVGFRAIERVGPSLRVVHSDISAALLAHARGAAGRLGIAGQTEFILADATELGPVPDGSIDVVTSRSALAYVRDKHAAMRAFFRVLKPGGRLSLGEPIMRDEAMSLIAALAWAATHTSQAQGSVLPLLLRWRATQFPSTHEAMEADPLTSFTERDLVAITCASGFKAVHMELHIDVGQAPASCWATFLASSPHPWAPTAERLLGENFTPEERAWLEATIRPVIERGTPTALTRMAYLTASKP